MYILQRQKNNLCISENLSKTFKMTDDGYVKSCFGMNVIKDINGTITMSQPAIIDKILNSQVFVMNQK